MIQISRCHAIGAGSLVLPGAACSPPVRARARYPERPVRVVVASAPGGVGDSLIRLLAPSLEQTLGQKLAIDARPGASGTLAMLETVPAGADGHTILVGVTCNFVINQFLTRLPFDPLAAVTPIAKIAEVPIVFFSNPSVPARHLGAFIAHARANPGKLNYGSPGIGTVNHLLIRRLEEESGIALTHVPYRGTRTAMLALLANDIQLLPIAAMLGAAHLAEGRLTALLPSPSAARSRC